MRYAILMLLVACTPKLTLRGAYCEAARRRATQCGIRFPKPDHCERGSRGIGDPDEMSCGEIEEKISKYGYLW